MKYFNKKDFIDSVSKKPIYQEMLKQMKLEVDNFFKEFKDRPNLISNWGHHYFCKDDGGVLIFNLNKPHDHECSICHKKYQSELLDNVWVYYYRNNVCINAWKSALVYHITKDKKYLNNIKFLIDFYSKNYLKFKLHNKENKFFNSIEEMEWGCGRIMPQGLNESIWLIRMFNAFEIVKAELDLNDLNLINNLATNAFEVLKPQVNKIHNISCWCNSCIANMGLFTNNYEMINFSFNSEYGLYKLISEGVTKDYFWYEGSIHYNFFALEGIINSLVFAKAYNYKVNKKYRNTISTMLLNAYQYSFDNLRLPNPNDGWPDINLKTYGYIYDMAVKVFNENSLVCNVAKNIYNGNIERKELPLSRPYYYKDISLEKLTLIPSIDYSKYQKIIHNAHNFKNSDFAILRKNNINIFYKYGHNGPSHAHPDKMNIEVMINDQMLTRDLSNSGYGSNLCNEWHRVTASHNTVVCNGLNQISMRRGKSINFRNDYLKAACYDVYRDQNVDVTKMKKTMNPDEIIKYLVRYLSFRDEEAKNIINNNINLDEAIKKKVNELPKIDYIRTIHIIDNGFNDVFDCLSDKENTYDYFFHSEAKLLTNIKYRSDNLGYKSNGYQHLRNIKRIISRNRKINLLWKLDNMIIQSRIHLYNNAKLYLMDTYDNPITNFRTSFMIRSVNKNARFKVEWRILEVKKDGN